MKRITLNISNTAYDKVIATLLKFHKNEIEIIAEHNPTISNSEEYLASNILRDHGLIFNEHSIKDLRFNLSEIKEIAEQMDTGMLAYYNEKTGELIFAPDRNSGMVDEEFFEEEYDKIDNDEDVVAIEAPTSDDSFKIMEAFMHSLPDDVDLKRNLFQALQRRKPFREFKNEVDDSDFRNAWFAFKDAKMMEWVIDRLR